MVEKTRTPPKSELFNMDKMDLLKLIKQLRDEIKELRLTIRARNITIREEKAKRKKYWETIKRYRELVGTLSNAEKLYGDD